MTHPASSHMIPSERLVLACRDVPERLAWLEALPRTIELLHERWALSATEPWTDQASCAWVAAVTRADGTRAVLKLGMPHMEGEHEIDGLRFWNGDPAVRLLEADVALNAMLLERCEPGTPLRELSDPEQDVIISDLLHRLWRSPCSPHPFRPLHVMIAEWRKETLAASAQWIDPGLVRAGLSVFDDLSRQSADDTLLATDLHAGNVLRAQRQPWLLIDPKPFIGDRAYDATQHLLNCPERLATAPLETIARFADLLEVDKDRIRQWMFARAAAEPRERWSDASVSLARALR